jgi:hypothetical protein
VNEINLPNPSKVGPGKMEQLRNMDPRALRDAELLHVTMKGAGKNNELLIMR